VVCLVKSSYLSISPLNSVGLFTEDLGCPPPAAGAAAAGRFWVMPLAMAFWIAVWKAAISNCVAIVGFGGFGGIGSVGKFVICVGGIGLYAKNVRKFDCFEVRRSDVFVLVVVSPFVVVVPVVGCAGMVFLKTRWKKRFFN
jgi:hypothetical protein